MEITKINSLIREILLIEESIYYKNTFKNLRISEKNILTWELTLRLREVRKKDKINSVKNNGIDINDLEKWSVFQKFYRSKQAEKLGIKGFGLSLVKSIVDEASGRIDIIDNNLKRTILK